MIPNNFGYDLGDEIDWYAMLIDENNNEFKIRVERINGSIFLTKGLAALRDFYDISSGAWFTLVFMGLGRFQIKKLSSIIKRKINIPAFVPPMRFAVEKSGFPQFNHHGFPASVYDLSYRHDPAKFEIFYEKHLTSFDVTSGFVVSRMLFTYVKCYLCLDLHWLSYCCLRCWIAMVLESSVWTKIQLRCLL